MFKKIKDAFSEFTFLSPKDLFQIASITRIKRVRKNELLVSVDDLNYSVYVVLNGLLCHYVTDKAGNERMLRFAPEKSPAASMDTLFLGNKATENIMALENTIVLYFDFRSYNKLASKNIRLLKVQNNIYKDLIRANVTHIKFLNVMSAEERYVSFCKEFPHLESRVRQKYLASYLGVTPTSLSRLKARMNAR